MEAKWLQPRKKLYISLLVLTRKYMLRKVLCLITFGIWQIKRYLLNPANRRTVVILMSSFEQRAFLKFCIQIKKQKKDNKKGTLLQQELFHCFPTPKFEMHRRFYFVLVYWSWCLGVGISHNLGGEHRVTEAPFHRGQASGCIFQGNHTAYSTNNSKTKW